MKLNKEVLQKVKQIEITTRRFLSGSFLGEHQSNQKGSGLEFDQLRDYVIGDDVRFIDWKTTSKTGRLVIKEYIQERNRTIMLLIDKSASTRYGSHELLKSDMINQVASVFSIVAECARDYCGALFFNDRVAKIIPPSKSRAHTHRLMEECFSYEPQGGTDFEQALQKFLALQKKESIVFIISDFLNFKNYESSLRIITKHHEVVAVHCLDRQETELDIPVQMVFEDPETGKRVLVEGRSEQYKNLCNQTIESARLACKKYNIDVITLTNDQDLIGTIIQFFRKKMR